MELAEREKGSGEGKAFIKLADGESVAGVFRGQPFVGKKHWNPASNRSAYCTGEGCELCAKGDRPRFSARLNLIVNEGGSYVPKVFEMGGQVYDYLVDLNKDMPLDGIISKITRKGTGKNTNYIVVPGKALTPEQEKAVSRVELVNLDPGAPAPAEGQDANEDAPF